MKIKHPILHIIALATSVIIALLTFFIYSQEASFGERLIYAFIVGLCTWIMLSVALWTLFWIVEGLKK